MKSGALRRALGLTLLYIVLFIAIVVAQFSRGPGFSEKFGELTVSASYPKPNRASADAAPESVRISFGGLVIGISSNSKAESLDAGGSARNLPLTGIAKLPSGVRIGLGPGVSLSAIADPKAPDRFSLTVTAPDGVAGVRLRLDTPPARFVKAAAELSVISGPNSYALSLGAGSLDADSGFVILRPGDAGLALARIAAPIAAKPAPAPSAEKFVAQPPKDPAAFTAEIAAWRDKVWSGLSGTRYQPDKVAWEGSDGAVAFSEKSLTAYLAEAFVRGQYPDALARARSAKDKWVDRLGFLSAPYLGGLVNKMRDMRAADLAEARRLAELIAEKSPTILEKEGLLLFLVDRAPNAQAKDALRFLAEVDPSKITVRQAIGFLGCVVDARDLLKDEENPIQNGDAASQRLVGATRKTANGYFLITEDDGSTDIRLSLLAGKAMQAYGESAAKPELVGIGQSLVEGVIGLSDAEGFTPARVMARNGVLEQKMGSTAPEELYPLVAANPDYPHEKSFSRTLGPGLWAWTCAPALDVQSTGTRYVFTASFPAGRAHYLAFYGIKPFANIQLYDIDYNPDNDFESYDASGYLYNKDASALYLKMKHKKDIEDIKLSF